MKFRVGFLVFFVYLTGNVWALEFGIDRLEKGEFDYLFAKKRLAVLTHAAGRSKTGAHLIDLVREKFLLKKIFAPEHGLRSLEDDFVNDSVDPVTKLPIISLYKRQTRAPSREELSDIDAIVVDLQDVGVRYYTYFSTLAQVMKSASENNVDVIVLDRPNILGGDIVEGATLDEKYLGNFISFYNIPTRHGMTLGELAQMYHFDMKLQNNLSIVPVLDWKRENLLSSWDRTWINPSPALTSIDQVYLYALWGSLESLNLAVGRGVSNELAFYVFGAPWIREIESREIARLLNQQNLDGVEFSPHSWLVTRAEYVGERAYGVKIKINARTQRSDEFTYNIMRVLKNYFKERLVISKTTRQFIGSDEVVDALIDNKDWSAVEAQITRDIFAFKIRRAPFLLY